MLSIKNLTVKVNDKTILHDFNLDINDGEIVTLHPQTPYSSKRQRKGERRNRKIENKYPVEKFNRFCNDSESYKNE